MVRIFISIILIFGTIVVGIFYLGPAWHTFQTIRSTTQNLADISTELDDLIQNRDTLIETINEISKNDLDRLQRALPQGINGAQFLVILEAAIVRFGLQINGIDIATAPVGTVGTSGTRAQPKPINTPAAKAPTTIGELPFSITVTGSYESIKNFIATLEQMVPFIDVTEISFNSPSRPDTFTVLIKAKTYYQ